MGPCGTAHPPDPVVDTPRERSLSFGRPETRSPSRPVMERSPIAVGPGRGSERRRPGVARCATRSTATRSSWRRSSVRRCATRRSSGRACWTGCAPRSTVASSSSWPTRATARRPSSPTSPGDPGCERCGIGSMTTIATGSRSCTTWWPRAASTTRPSRPETAGAAGRDRAGRARARRRPRHVLRRAADHHGQRRGPDPRRLPPRRRRRRCPAHHARAARPSARAPDHRVRQPAAAGRAAGADCERSARSPSSARTSSGSTPPRPPSSSPRRTVGGSTPTSSTDLAERTEGWIASLQLVQAALRDRSPAEIRRFVRTLNGADHELYDYLAEEVVGDLDEELQRFLDGDVDPAGGHARARRGRVRSEPSRTSRG